MPGELLTESCLLAGRNRSEQAAEMGMDSRFGVHWHHCNFGLAEACAVQYAGTKTDKSFLQKYEGTWPRFPGEPNGIEEIEKSGCKGICSADDHGL